jgi:hypothetical protein
LFLRELKYPLAERLTLDDIIYGGIIAEYNVISEDTKLFIRQRVDSINHIEEEELP